MLCYQQLLNFVIANNWSGLGGSCLSACYGSVKVAVLIIVSIITESVNLTGGIKK